MEENLEELVATLAISLPSTNVLYKITSILEEQTSQSIILFVFESLQSLCIIERWAWQVLSKDFREWIDEKSYIDLFYALHSFNIKLLSNHDEIEFNIKTSLLIPSNTDWVDGILDQIKSSNDTFLTIVSLWFDIISYLAHECSEIRGTSTIIYINNRLARDFLMTNEYQIYLKQLQKPHSSEILFTPKQLFYLKTCSFSLHVYLCSKLQQFPFTGEQIVKFLADNYLQMIRIQSYIVDSWSKELLSCIAHLIALICSCCWWSDEKPKYIKMLVASNDLMYDHILALIHIVSYQPFHQCISAQWYNDETLLIDAILVFLYGTLEIEDVRCFISSQTNLFATLLVIAQVSPYDRICICAYGFLAEILTDEQMKELKITENISGFFFNILEQAWKDPTKRCFLSLSKNDTIQSTTANSNKIPLLIDLCDEYPMTFDILWALSFNSSIQQQLQSNQLFMMKLAQIEHDSSDESMRKIVNGILWNLNSNHEEYAVLKNHDNTTFDIMISYSHKDEQICKQLYDELVRAGYRVWIDFDHMHGNVMDAMAQAIEQSRIIIICMSEHYRRSNYCRAEAQYAFQRQLKMVPILLQKYYKPDGWLSFLTAQLLYIDFTKHDFSHAIAISSTLSSLEESWTLFKRIYNKQYNSIDDEQARRSIWEKNVEMIQRHNLEADLGIHTYTMKVNQFADLTFEEFVKKMNTLKINDQKRENKKFSIPSNIVLPSSVDWRTKGYVTPVKNQGHCSSCWAFSTTGSLEGQHAKISRNLVSLSEQQLVDCSTKYGNDGCEGGLIDPSFQYIKDNNGIDSEDSYPYEAKDSNCRFNIKNVVTNVTDFVDIKSQSEIDLKYALATIGPIAVAIDANHDSFRFYSSGVYSEATCSTTLLDFSLLSVGYDTTKDNLDYYILKNQWTAEWGNQGYVWMSRHKNNQCGIATMASYPLV
ncbi:unnamed protein product [Rotaria sordida]|uniref:TIR domain-containing protein n=1 Tax=Rotaria sordida TaxID=392033 RepID=A0A819E267_9BILA|nr:unnamed protein product [Rotaria sordida]